MRSSVILEASAEYFVEHSKDLNTPQINSVAKVFGNLNIHPSNGFKFWDKLETILEQKFAEFPPKDLIHLMMSFIYIEKYPVNLAHKIFNPNFVDRIENGKEGELLLFFLAKITLLSVCKFFKRDFKKNF